MRLSLSRRLQQLERFSGGACSYCSGREPILLRGAEQEAPACEVCGQRLPAVRLLRDPDFYRNADRLRQGGADTP
jgi:hypothetical protein